MSSSLAQLEKLTTIVADTGDFESIKQFKPTDATTNPSLLLSAAQLPGYRYLIDQTVENVKSFPKDERMAECMDELMVNFGCEILKIVPGRVSTEVDAHLSYDIQGTVAKALKLIALYERKGIPKDRVLIKVASTWEGIQAGKILEAEHGIHCNLTLLFSFVQAVACAEAGVTLISPFVGRILDWYKKAEGRDYSPQEDPGVLSVKQIYNYLKKHDYKTIVMGASFRNSGEIVELAGIDYLTISPKLLGELGSMDQVIDPKLSVNAAKESQSMKVSYLTNEALFRKDLATNQMATELLTDGIRRFAEDSQKLQDWISKEYNL